MAKFLAIGIKYDTDGYRVKLPKNMVVECDDEDEVVDAISDETGWLVESVEDIQEITMNSQEKR
jgi:hypothetical protein